MRDDHGKTRSSARFGALAAACMFLTAAPCAAQSAPGAERPGQLGNLVIEGETRMQVKGDKPAEVSDLDPKAYVENFIVSYIRENNPTEKLDISYPLYLPSRLESDSVLSPWRGRLIEAPVLSLLVKTPRGVKVANWRLVIASDQGKVFRTIKGKGVPPPNITWDGLSDSGEPLRVGHPYAYSLAVLDEYEVPTYLFGKSVTVRGFVYKTAGQLNIAVDTGMLFAKGLSFSPNGYIYAREMQDRLRKFLDRKISVRVYGDDPDLAQKEAELLRDYLEDELRLEKGAVAAKGYPADKNRYNRTEVTAVKS
ncbi:MAG: hypothetical protein WCW52_08565 [Elusimicrobiales bacterium]|jgi:hypothetical protein